MPLSASVSNPSAKPLAPYGPAITVVVKRSPTATLEPENKVTPASTASGQLSPSESISWWFGNASLSWFSVQTVNGLALGTVLAPKLNRASYTPP